MEYSRDKLIERAEKALSEIREEIKMAESYIYWSKKDAYKKRSHTEHELERLEANLIEEGYNESQAKEIYDNYDVNFTSDLYENYFKDIDEAEEDLK